MAEKRITLMTKQDVFRQVLLQEPRGYPCQNADIIFPSALPGVQFGYVILEQNCIYPMMSGHNTICVATALLYSGMIAMPEGLDESVLAFDLEAPAGKKCYSLESHKSLENIFRCVVLMCSLVLIYYHLCFVFYCVVLCCDVGIISIRAVVQQKKVKSITLRNVPGFRGLSNCMVNVPQLGQVAVDVVYGNTMTYIPTATCFVAMLCSSMRDYYTLLIATITLWSLINLYMAKGACGIAWWTPPTYRPTPLSYLLSQTQAKLPSP